MTRIGATMAEEATVFDIIEEFAKENAKLSSELFDIAAKARQVDINMRPEIKERLGSAEVNAIMAAEGELVAQSERERIKTAVIENDLAMREAINQRVAAIEEALSPEVSFADKVAAASASEDALRAAFEMSVDGDDETGVLLALQAARAKGLEDLVAHITTVREDLGELLAEVAEADGVEEVDVESRFEL